MKTITSTAVALFLAKTGFTLPIFKIVKKISTIKTILLIGIVTKLSFAHLQIYPKYEQYVNDITPYLSSPIESGFFYFNVPNTFQVGNTYEQYRYNTPDLENQMLLIDFHTDSLVGFTHYKYQQLFKSIPVEGAGCIEHFDKKGSLSFINAKFVENIRTNAIPNLTNNEAIEQLINNLKNNHEVEFAWENQAWEQQIRIDKNDSTASWYPVAELLFAVDELKNMQGVIDGSRYKLAYKITITTLAPSHETNIYYLDASDGSILKIRSNQCQVNGNVYGYGSKNLDTQWRGGFYQNYRLLAMDDGHDIHTKKYVENQTWSQMSETSSSSTNWGNTYLTETSTHFNVTNSWDYFKNTFNRNGMNGQGAGIHVYTQLNENNAFYQNNSTNDLVFGKTAQAWDYGMEPSIVGHEFTHGVTNYSSHLAYEHESGALNESFSDIFGTVIQAQTLDNGLTDWIIGNHIPTIPIQITRSLSNPQTRGNHWTGQYMTDLNGNFIFDPNNNKIPIYELGQPKNYVGNYFCDNCPMDVDRGGVHINSGVQNKWFNLLSAGQSNINLVGIGMNKASKIAYLALTSILMNSSQYTDSKEATITAAILLYGQCSQEHKSTVDAWNNVNISANYNCIPATINEFINPNKINIYPNPTSSILNFELPFISDKTIYIFDLHGKIIKEINPTELYFQTDVSNIDNGIYLIEFQINNQRITKKILIEK